MRWAGLLALALLGLVGLSGCATPPSCPAADAMGLVTPQMGGDFMATDGRQPWDALVLRTMPANQQAKVSVAAAPDAWLSSETVLGDAQGQTQLLRIRTQPATGTSANVTLGWWATRESDGCQAGTSGHLRWSLSAPQAGDVAHVGAGARVLTAGFFENGTLFYTNIEAIDQDPNWAKSPIYAWEGGDALPVYVYDRDRGERSAAWSATTAGTPVGPATGNVSGWSYFTTIPGFNEALKGLSTNTVRVVRLEPEAAYTDGNHTDHPLYGLPLVFLIKVVAVEEDPCPDASGCIGPSMSRKAGLSWHWRFPT